MGTPQPHTPFWRFVRKNIPRYSWAWAGCGGSRIWVSGGGFAAAPQVGASPELSGDAWSVYAPACRLFVVSFRTRGRSFSPFSSELRWVCCCNTSVWNRRLPSINHSFYILNLREHVFMTNTNTISTEIPKSHRPGRMLCMSGFLLLVIGKPIQ